MTHHALHLAKLFLPEHLLMHCLALVSAGQHQRQPAGHWVHVSKPIVAATDVLFDMELASK